MYDEKNRLTGQIDSNKMAREDRSPNRCILKKSIQNLNLNFDNIFTIISQSAAMASMCAFI